MICVSIGRGRHKHMIAEHRHLVEQGAELVELRLDYINREVNLKRLLGERPGPVILTCRRQVDGGKWNGSEDSRLMLLRAGIAEGAEFVDLEDDIAHLIPRYGKTKRIISCHNLRETPQNLEAIYARLAALDADIVKIATMAHNPHDNLRMLQLISSRPGKPIAGLCMGEIGTPSRILAGKFGSPFTYATFHHERQLAPGQLSYRQMTDIYRYEEITPEWDLYGVIADPIGHSLSPRVHNASFREKKLNCAYVPFRVPRQYLDAFLDDCPALGVKGLSVTIPHKEEVIRRLTKVDGTVRGVGAANTIVFRDGEMFGYNTDYHAAMDSLDEVVGATPSNNSLAGRTALVLGSGGVARAICYGLGRRGTNLMIASRTLERAEELADQMKGKAVPWEDRFTIKADLLVNCTPIGMHPYVDDTPYERHNLRPSMVVFDTVYNPEQTLLIKEARRQNCKTITGVEMFVRQAALQFKLFTGQEAPSEVMRNEVRKAIGAAKLQA